MFGNRATLAVLCVRFYAQLTLTIQQKDLHSKLCIASHQHTTANSYSQLRYDLLYFPVVPKLYVGLHLNVKSRVEICCIS